MSRSVPVLGGGFVPGNDRGTSRLLRCGVLRAPFPCKLSHVYICVCVRARVCVQVEKLLASTERHLSRLRRAAPDPSLSEAVQHLTRRFLLCLPFPRAGEWLRGVHPVHKTFTTEDDVEARR